MTNRAVVVGDIWKSLEQRARDAEECGKLMAILMETWTTTVLTGMWKEGAGLMRLQKKKSKATGNCTRPSVLHSGKECDYALSVSKNFE